MARERTNWPPAGDNQFIEMGLARKHLPAGTRLAVGTAAIQITDTTHDGCASFIERYDRDACIYVNAGEGKRLRLRGVYARVVQDGRV